MKCRTCNGTGFVFRSVKKYEKTITRIEYEGGSDQGRPVIEKKTVTGFTGGEDACPQCAAGAEAEWKSIKKSPA